MSLVLQLGTDGCAHIFLIRSSKAEFAMIIAEALRDNNHLERLELDFNKIGASGMAALRDAAAESTSLNYLGLSSNRPDLH